MMVERFEHQGVLGTVIDVRVGTDAVGLAEEINRTIFAEISRLQDTFSAFDEQSELWRWRRGEPVQPSLEFCELMGAVLNWQQRSGGRFNPLTGVLSAVWAASEGEGRLPDPAAMNKLADQIAALTERQLSHRLLDRVDDSIDRRDRGVLQGIR